ncbi:PQQ-binding-like beta-propeller repeat protein [bacterium]|nr:PQQ-binding-like beta-propeller repeat protein [bacterium]
MNWIRQELLQVAVKWGEGISRTGEPYGWLIDCREFLLQKDYLARVCEELGPRLKEWGVDSLAGYTLAAHPLALGLSFWAARQGWQLDVNLIRREPKSDGLQRQIEGPPLRPGQRVALVDDLINSGSTQMSAVRIVRQAGGVVAGVAVLLDYERAGSQWLRSQAIPVERLLTLSELGIQRPRHCQALQPNWCVPALNLGQYSAPKSSAEIAGDRLYLGSDQGFVLCLDRAGEEIWRFWVRDRQRGVHSTPQLSEDRLYFGAYDGYFYCLQASTGQLIWEVQLGQWIGATCLLDGERLYVGVEYGEMGGCLMALDRLSGRRLWEAPAGHYVHSRACRVGDLVCFGANDGLVRALRPESGELVWKFQTLGPIKSDLSGNSQVLLVASGDGILYCLEGQSGRLLWQRRLGRQLYCRPLISGSRVLAGGDGTCLVALDLEDGRVCWAAPLGASIIGGACLGPDNQFWCAAVDGTIARFDQQGLPTGYLDTGHTIRNRVAGDGEQVLVASMNGPLYAFCKESQSQRS